MKVICTQENLKYGLSLVSPLSSKNVNLPILNNILIQTEEGNIRFLATNLEIAVSCVVRGKIEETGSYTLPAKLFYDYVQLLPKEKVELVLSEKKEKGESESLKISCGNYETKIKGVSASEFPLVPKVNKTLIYTCKIDDIKKAVSQTIFSASNNEARPEICGVFMRFSEKELTVAATDSYRLSEKTLPIQKSNSSQGEKDQKVIVPARTLQELVRILGNIKALTDIENVENLQICFSDNQIVFTVGQIELTSRLIEGQYPDYKQIIPQNFDTTAEFQATELASAVKSVSLFSRSGIYDIHITFSPETKEVQIHSQSAQVGENKCVVFSQISGKKNSIVLNYRYILDSLQNIGTEEVAIKLIDGSNPCILEPKNSKDYLNIIMPIKQ